MLNHDDVQAAISARLDGESYDLADDVIDTHVANCPECADFQQRTALLSRTLHSESQSDGMAPPLDLSDSILAGVETQWHKVSSQRHTSLVLARLALVLLGICFAGWAVSQVVASSSLLEWSDNGTTLSPSASPEFATIMIEGAALRFGVSFGLFFAAWKPSCAPGMLPVVGTMLMFLAGATVRDFALGTSNAEQFYILVGLLLSVLLLLWVWLVEKGYIISALWRQLRADPV